MKNRFSFSKNKLLLAVILFAVSFIVIGASFLFYRDRTAGFKLTVLEIDGEEAANMRYFLKRLLMSGEPPLAMFERLTREFIVKKMAPNPPYNINISGDEIINYLKDTAKAQSESISDNEFKEWYRQQLNETQLSDIELRDLIYRNLLTKRLSAYLAEKVPTVAPQVYIHMIVVQSFDQAKEVKAKLDSGEDFFELAQTYNVEESLRARKGQIGWVPRNALEPGLAILAFDELESYQYSSPVSINQELFAIIMVTEKVRAREIDKSALQTVKARALDQWYREESEYHEITFHGFNNGYDNETDAWISWQLEKMKK